MKERAPRGFALLLAVALTVDAFGFMIGYNFDSAEITAASFGAALISVGLTWFAYRNYPRKWQVVLLRVPFALFWPVVSSILIGICAFLHNPKGC
jgi:hypothetical protein